MAASRMKNSGLRLCHRYQYFFYVAIVLVCLQLYMGYSFYNEIKTLDTGENRRRGNVKNVEKSMGDTKPYIPLKTRFDHPDSKTPKRLENTNESQKNISKYYENCIVSRDSVLSALQRAKSDQCKDEIRHTACLDQKKKLYPIRLPRHCPLKDEKNAGKYIGCFRDHENSRMLKEARQDFNDDNSPAKCINMCHRSGQNLAGMQYGKECWCGSVLKETSKPVNESNCNYPCPGDKKFKCGGYRYQNVYYTGYGKKPENPSRIVAPEELDENIKPARIVYTLTVNGRAYRQVIRLFKTLYHVDHYFYIHVDSRQDYLHRKISLLTKNFTNVKVAPRRMSTIWGGASLLGMHLTCLEDLLKIKEWKWDYFINLSESDFPLKTHPELVAYLSYYKGHNFVRNHGRDTPKFIRKQGLDWTFYECDTHMWRLDKREIPMGIRINGGSDWYALYREFAEYAINSKDELVTGLKHFYKYTLLPAESFFHTLLENSRYCDTLINNNLHLTNWRRRQGCKCQYKAIVDWCGCSPNDFMPEDRDKIASQKRQPIYFGRKFEAVVNQQIINRVDFTLFGSYPEETPGIDSYWQSEYTHQDDSQKVGDEFRTNYESLARISTKQLQKNKCEFTTGPVEEITLYSHLDKIEGYIVHYNATSVQDGRVYPVEAYLKKTKIYRVLQPMGPANRLAHIEVGTSFDPKEELFRNFGGFFGPFSDLKISHSWGLGKQFSPTFVWIDPAGNVAAMGEQKIEQDEQVLATSSNLHLPLLPGVWTVKVLYLWAVAAETEFTVLPLSVYKGKTITERDIRDLDYGAQSNPITVGAKVSKALDIKKSEEKVTAAWKNSKKIGSSLLEWIDTLTAERWKVQDMCVVGNRIDTCSLLEPCRDTTWSDFSPDPKSEIGPIDQHSGRIR